MLRALKVRPGGTFGAAADSVTLDHDGRFRRRVALTGARGTAFLLDLPEAAALKDGDGLELEDGRIVVVRAAEEALMEITADSPQHLARLAWHIGNRHLPAEIGPDRILIRPDHVIADMIAGLGGRVRPVCAPFEPEGGAYAHQHGHAGHHHHHHHHHEGDGDG